MIRSTKGLAAKPAEATPLGASVLAEPPPVRGPASGLYSIAAATVERTIHTLLCAGVLLSSNPAKSTAVGSAENGEATIVRVETIG